MSYSVVQVSSPLSAALNPCNAVAWRWWEQRFQVDNGIIRRKARNAVSRIVMTTEHGVQCLSRTPEVGEGTEGGLGVL